MLAYCYKSCVLAYERTIEIDDPSQLPEFATLTPPLPHIDDAVAILWNPTSEQWEYHEIPLPGPNVRRGYMDERLGYADIRILHYPPHTDYLDAVVKNDTVAQQAYIDACQAVKARWPKDMEPITRREYLVQVYGMRLYVPSIYG